MSETNDTVFYDLSGQSISGWNPVFSMNYGDCHFWLHVIEWMYFRIKWDIWLSLGSMIGCFISIGIAVLISLPPSLVIPWSI